MTKKRLYKILKNAMENMKTELTNDGIWDDDDIRLIVMKKFCLSEDDYEKIMNEKETNDLVETG